MKQKILIAFVIISFISCSQTTETVEQKSENNTETVDKESENNTEFISIETPINLEYATKEGIYIGEYVVHIEYDKLEELDGKIVKISGDVSIVKGLEKEFDKEGNEIISQGRSGDTKHIVNPIIEIVE